jgi:hypothetical protein
MKRGPVFPVQYMVLGKWIFGIRSGSARENIFGRVSGYSFPKTVAPVLLFNSAVVTPCLRANSTAVAALAAVRKLF